MFRIIIYLLVVFNFCLLAQDTNSSADLNILEYFIGQWSGESKGIEGKACGNKEYKFILNNTYVSAESILNPLMVEDSTIWAPHKDHAIFSYDNFRKKLVMRRFNSEGHISKYALDSLSDDKRYFLLKTESIENGPPCMKARYTLIIEDEDKFSEKLELKYPGRDYTEWRVNIWQRQK